jgi:hypothetical protein
LPKLPSPLEPLRVRLRLAAAHLAARLFSLDAPAANRRPPAQSSRSSRLIADCFFCAGHKKSATRCSPFTHACATAASVLLLPPNQPWAPRNPPEAGLPLPPPTFPSRRATTSCWVLSAPPLRTSKSNTWTRPPRAWLTPCQAQKGIPPQGPRAPSRPQLWRRRAHNRPVCRHPVRLRGPLRRPGARLVRCPRGRHPARRQR